MTSFVPTPWTWPQTYWSSLVEGPVEEPLTIDEGKLRAGLDWPDGDPRDVLMHDFIRAARAQVEHDTGLALLTQTHDVTFADGGLGYIVPLPPQTQPAQSLTLLPLGLRVTLPRVYRPGTLQTVEWPAGPVRVVSGWPTPAALRAEAPGLYHAVSLLVAHMATLGRDLATLAGGPTQPGGKALMTPMGYEEAIGPHRLVWGHVIAPSARVGLRPWRIEIEHAVETTGGSGAPMLTWTRLLRVFAQRESMTGDERFIANQLSARQYTQWTFAYDPRMDPDVIDVPKTRRVRFEGRTYDITRARRVGEQGAQLELVTLVSTATEDDALRTEGAHE